jgi:hypothetical protein
MLTSRFATPSLRGLALSRSPATQTQPPPSVQRARVRALATTIIVLKDRLLEGDDTLMSYTRQRKGSSYLILGGVEGIDFVRCRICGDHRRVISGRHLSKHDTDRETYMENMASRRTN